MNLPAWDSTNPHQRLDELIGLLRDDELNDHQSTELRNLLADEPGAVRRFCEHMAMNTALDTVCRQFLPEVPEPRKHSQSILFRFVMPIGLAAAAVALLAVLTVSWWPEPQADPGGEVVAHTEDKPATIDPASEQPPWESFAAHSDEAVAMLTMAPDAIWSSDGHRSPAGGYMTPGTYQLDQGSAQIEFYCGAVVVLQGPAQFEVLSATRAVLHNGRLFANVPPAAQGFTIKTAGMDVVDLGTEFALVADDNNQTELHVLTGKVLVRDIENTTKTPRREQLIEAGHAVRMANGLVTQTVWREDTNSFNSISLANDSMTRRQSQYQRWQAMSKRLSEDPDAVLYFNFEQRRSEQNAWDRKLHSAATESTTQVDGAIVGCAWTEGRWPEKGALEFKRLGDRVRLPALGEFKALTYLAWIRVEGLPHWYTSLMQTDNWDRAAPHWHISKDGEVGLGIRGQGTFRTPRVIRPEDLGRWIMIATVYDQPNGEVRHYIDGRLSSQFYLDDVLSQDPLPLKIGTAEIGNWSVNDPEILETVSTLRSLNGLIDEFGLFGRAMSESEIENIYEAGKPTR